MPDLIAKKTGDLVRVLERNGEPAIQNNWTFVRFEPDSGNLVAEKDGKRIVSLRPEFEKLNFPGSSEVWDIVNQDEHDEHLAKARTEWAKLNLSGLIKALLDYARTLDPALAGIQTIADLAEKVRELKDVCASAVELLRLDTNRAEAAYNRCQGGTALENDQKDTLLEHWHDLQNRYAARLHRHEKLVPAWCRLVDALESAAAAAKTA